MVRTLPTLILFASKMSAANATQQILRHFRPSRVFLRAQHKDYEENSIRLHTRQYGLWEADGIW